MIGLKLWPQPAFGLVLGGGASLGLTYVGVHRALSEAGYAPSAIAGCSVGAAMGALWAAGLTSEDIERALSRARWHRYASLFGGTLSLFTLNKLGLQVESLCGAQRIEDLPIPLAVLATDLATGEPVVLREGPLGESVAASCAIPGVFAPVKLGGRLLVDGGVHQNLPLHLLNHHRGLKFILAVDPIRRLQLKDKPRNAMAVLLQAFLIHLRSQAEAAQKECARPLLLIAPETRGVNVMNLRQLPQLQRIGYEEAQRVIAEHRRWFEHGPPRHAGKPKST